MVLQVNCYQPWSQNLIVQITI
uniref:Uncharacterized protein n=1 Tax=Rhizophora mucronata TaxID=61149 RepID=A0A2P2Q0H7_RHIMU